MPNSLKVAIQMDPPERIDIRKDSTFVLGLEAQKRGYDLHYYNPDTLGLRDGVVSAQVSTLEFRREMGNHVTLGTPSKIDLSSFDIILMRQDFNDPESYNALTHMLDHLKGKTLVMNDPEGVREAPEKILITHYPDLAPKTLITRDFEQIEAFYRELGQMILKPLNGFGGLDVNHIKPDTDNLREVYDDMCKKHTEPFILQEYLPEVRTGDKRIIVVEGEPVGTLLRVPQDGDVRANLHAGGQAVKTEITDHERDLCKTLKPELVKRGLVFVGLDVIGDYVTEINPKSPTGLQPIYDFDGIKCEEAIWDAFENRYKSFKNKD